MLAFEPVASDRSDGKNLRKTLDAIGGIGILVACSAGTHFVYVPVSGHSLSVTREVVFSG